MVVVIWPAADVAAEIGERQRIIELLGGIDLGRWSVSLSLRERRAAAPGWPTLVATCAFAPAQPGEIALAAGDELVELPAQPGDGAAGKSGSARRGVLRVRNRRTGESGLVPQTPAVTKRNQQRLLVLRMSHMPASTYFCLATPSSTNPPVASADSGSREEAAASAAAATAAAAAEPARESGGPRWELLEAGLPAEAVLDKFGLFERKRDRCVEGARYKVGDFVVGLGGVKTRGGTQHVALQVEYLPCRHVALARPMLEAFLAGLGVPLLAGVGGGGGAAAAAAAASGSVTARQLDGSYAAAFRGLAGGGETTLTPLHVAAQFVHAFQDVR
jgi:hypothetical protein